jgi:hypothetical protein
VEGSRKIETMDTAVSGHFKEVRVQILVEVGAKVFGELRKAFCKLVRFLELLDGATGRKDSQHEFTVIDIRVERGCIAADVPKMRGMGLPRGNVITNTAVDGSVAVQVWTMEVDAVPAPVVPGDRARLDVP